LYGDLLRREGETAGMAFWLDHLQKRGTSRAAVARGFLDAQESFERALDSVYAQFLQRPVDEAGQGRWLSVLQDGSASLDEVATKVLASDEFRDNARRTGL